MDNQGTLRQACFHHPTVKYRLRMLQKDGKEKKQESNFNPAEQKNWLINLKFSTLMDIEPNLQDEKFLEPFHNNVNICYTTELCT